MNPIIFLVTAAGALTLNSPAPVAFSAQFHAQLAERTLLWSIDCNSCTCYNCKKGWLFGGEKCDRCDDEGGAGFSGRVLICKNEACDVANAKGKTPEQLRQLLMNSDLLILCRQAGCQKHPLDTPDALDKGIVKLQEFK